MKAISLTQPWASLVAIGAKQIETRSWGTNYRGPIAIHASKGFPRDCRALCFDEPFYSVLHGAGLVYPDTELGFGGERFPLPLGAILAVASLQAVYPIVDGQPYGLSCSQVRVSTHHVFEGSARERAFGDYTPGRFAWWFSNIRRVVPIGCRGALGLWTVPPEVAEVVAKGAR